jgi:hypothetical protein
VSEQSDPAVAPSASEQALDVAARLAGLTRQTRSASLFGRRPAEDVAYHTDPPAEASPAATEPAAPFTEALAADVDASSDMANELPQPEGMPVPESTTLVAADEAAAVDAVTESESPAPPIGDASTSTPIGRLTRVSASEMWSDDAEFAGWLVHDPTLLGEAIALGLLSATAGASPNRLIATASDGSRVSVVAETGSSSERGLAAIVELASIGGSDAIVWLAGEVDDAHRASVSWLNRTTDASFFLVRVEGARIGPSATAALLEAVVRPARATDGERTAPVATGDNPGRRADDHEPAS